MKKNPVSIRSLGQSFFSDNLVVLLFFQHQSVFVLIAYHKYYHTITIILGSTFVPKALAIYMPSWIYSV